MAAWWIEAGWNFDLVEFDSVRSRQPNGLGDTVLLDQAADYGPALAVDARLDARVVANGDEARLDRADGTVGELANEDVAVVDVHAHKTARCTHHPLADEVAHGAHHTGEISTHPPVADVDDWRAVAFQRRRLQQGLIGGRVNLTQRHLRVEPLGVLFVAVEDEGSTDEVRVEQLAGEQSARAVAEGEAELRLQPAGTGHLGCRARLAEVVGDRLLAQHMLAGFERGAR